MNDRVHPVRWSVVSWAPYSRRSEMFARELDAPHHCVHYLRFQSPPHAPFKYVLQTLATLRLLWRERPDAVHVQNPPFVCGLVVAAYGAVTGTRFVTEHHSAAFGRAWRWALPLQKLVARRAATNIVTNEHWAGVVGAWGGETLVMYDAFLDLPEGEPYAVGDGPSVGFIGVFADDEPLDAVLAAAALEPGVRFFVTGDLRKLPDRARTAAPPNVTFTGFLDPNGSYLGLLRAVDVAVVLTTRDHTLQLAGCEAIALGKPLVTSDWPYLEELFGKAAVYVAPTASSIHAGVVEALGRADDLAEQAVALREQRRAEWRERMQQLRACVAGDGAKHVRSAAVTTEGASAP